MPRNLFEPPGTEGPYLPTIMKPTPPQGTSAPYATPLQPAMGSTYPYLGAPQVAPQVAPQQYSTYFPMISAQAATSPYLPTIWQDPRIYTPTAGQGVSVGARAALGGNVMGDRSGLNRPTTQRPATQATTPGGQVEQQYAPAPPNVDAAWYRAFQREHNGETPEEFYARTGEGIDEAIADRTWAERFAQATGRSPSEWEFEEHWYNTRAYGRPQSDPGPGWRRKSKRGATDDEKRPPLYVPQATSWRL